MILKTLLTGLLATGAPAAELSIDADRVTLSGISSGGHLAHQLHLAHPELYSGVAILAGGPWDCARSELAVAMRDCMGQASESPPVEETLSRLRAAEAAGELGPLSAVAGDPVWLFHGTLDAMVAAPVADALAQLYRSLEAEVTYVDDLPAAHTFPVEDAEADCESSAPPFLGDCDYDAAGRLLETLYGDLHEPVPAHEDGWQALEIPAAEAAHMREQAWIYVPKSCSSEASCALHVVLHGCGQSAETIQRRFAEGAGYARWAEANDIVLLFPQARSSAGNPYACWDWWGYSGEDHLSREAPQLRAITELVRSLIAP